MSTDDVWFPLWVEFAAGLGIELSSIADFEPESWVPFIVELECVPTLFGLLFFESIASCPRST